MSIRSHPRPSRWLTAGVLLAAVACASGGAKSPSSPAPQTEASSRSQRGARTNTLTADEISNAHIPNVFDLVSSLRPRWLQTRGVDSFQKPSEIQVYLGTTRMQGGVSALRELSSLGITKIEFVDGITASARWGLDHGAGAIVVSMSAP
ncbi:hypothetical protein J421_0553 [Gemmatirosa kalamazoonensis]|jgi:hypothetical protein|uniref:Uncharacterized protein n=1 Tax=Gemmatirosa kalamazoonensis TaxID=861299 RepID=W0RCP0_9BACT|nr:hypothetical protein [Gemmatirosa kalamazoonensis]AHG88090.1 hypothetical protein J421_0553 [Gemmatirosa kalamazoonensis]